MEYQRARLRYQFEKLEPIRSGVYPDYGGNVEFELFSFFEICYHLKDWIEASHPELKGVDKFINNSPALRISADICNRLKHKVLMDKEKIVTHKRSHAPLGPFRLTRLTIVGPDPTMAREVLPKAMIQTERGDECCFALAKECMEEWDRYFEENSSTIFSS